MINMFNTLCDILLALKEHPDRSNELAMMLKDTLNNGFDNKIICEKVFITTGSDCYKEPAIIIPIMPTSDILDVNNLKYYDIEINTTSFSKSDIDTYSIQGVVTWILHEICENLITDNTLIRFKKMLIKYYNQTESGIKSVIRTIGYILWIGIFSRTNKSFIDETSNDFFTNFLRLNKLDYSEIWNNILTKYISKNGGDHNILTDNFIENKDKAEFLTFNRLARKYSAYAIKYNDTDYNTFAKYLIANEKSELLKYYIIREPKQLAIFKEKEIFNVFNDNKILYESAETELLEGPKTRNFLKEYSELEIDVDSVVTTSDKIKIAVKLKDFSTDLTKAIEDDILNNRALQDLREKVNTLINVLNKKPCEATIMYEFI